MSEFVRQFTPNWFTVTMGTGVLALALNQFVSAVPGLYGIALALCALAVSASVRAEPQGSPSSATARDAAPIDLTGYWVSYVTENWRYRMVTPAKGEYRRIPVSPAAVPVINSAVPPRQLSGTVKMLPAAAEVTLTVTMAVHAPLNT